jgi:hypothetical protein
MPFGMSERGSTGVTSFALGLTVLCAPIPAAARSMGAPFEGCNGCHGNAEGEGEAALVVAFDDETPDPGQTVMVTITVTWPMLARAGFNAMNESIGTFVAGSGTQLSGTSITHRGALSGSNGEASATFGWTLPEVPGGSALAVYAVAANGDNRNQGDLPLALQVPIAWGCDLVVLYADYDRDGVGSALHGVSGGCEPREGWSDLDADCNENSATTHPGAEEVCNERDDDCDGEVDEGTSPRPLYVDADGDGYGVPGESVLGCAVEPGYAEVDTDCDDADAENAPGFEEVCDGRDNDCDGRADEDVLARCGMGWCERLAESCHPESCVPGTPSPETCNAIDDDCDGEIDEEASGCEDELVCHLGVCLLPEDAAVVAALPTADPVAMPAATAEPTVTTTNPESTPSADASALPKSEGTGILGPSPSAPTQVATPAQAVPGAEGPSERAETRVPPASETTTSGCAARPHSRHATWFLGGWLWFSCVRRRQRART